MLGDLLVGALHGALTALAVHALLRPNWDMPLAMLAGMAVGMGVHLFLTLLFCPLLGFFPVMVSGSLVGMYGGMLFAMRGTMQNQSYRAVDSLWAGAVFGVAVTLGIQVYDRVLRGMTQS